MVEEFNFNEFQIEFTKMVTFWDSLDLKYCKVWWWCKVVATIAPISIVLWFKSSKGVSPLLDLMKVFYLFSMQVKFHLATIQSIISLRTSNQTSSQCIPTLSWQDYWALPYLTGVQEGIWTTSTNAQRTVRLRPILRMVLVWKCLSITMILLT